jgi:hypothetical protein
MNLLREMTGGGVFIDNGIVNCLGDNECLQPQGIPIIDDSAGLLGTPTREQSILTLDMIFEPRVVVGQIILVNSSTGGQQILFDNLGNPIGLAANAGTVTNFNGYYKVNSVKHRGMISGAVCGDAVTSLRMFVGTKSLVKVTQTIASVVP